MNSSKINENKNEEKFNLNDLKVTVEKYPLAESKNMFESFLIIGYDDIYITEKILKTALSTLEITKNQMNIIEDQINYEMTNLINFYCRDLPTILNTITSDFSGEILDQKKIIENVFPVPPKIFFSYEYFDLKPKKMNDFVVFSNIQNGVVNYGYGHIFYETKIIEDYKLYIPKAFVIISQYPFFSIFNRLCNEIKELFDSQNLEIPIEIQIYNIINFVPAPVDTGLKLTFIPKQELKIINYLKDQDNFFFSDSQEKYFISQLTGYRASEINFGYLINTISIELILMIYLNLICGRKIAFFYKDIDHLSIILHLFHQMLNPFSPQENVSCLSPIKFFCNDIVDQNIVGFLCNYDDLEKFDPFRQIKEGEFRCLTNEEENKLLAPFYFRCDYIFDLKNKIFKEPDKYISVKNEKYINENKKLNDFIIKLFERKFFSFSEDIPSDSSDFKKIVKDLYSNLEAIINKLSVSKRFQKKPNNSIDLVLSPFVQEYNFQQNHIILELFYQFSLNFTYIYYKYFSSYNGNFNLSKEQQINLKPKPQNETGLKDEEYLFFIGFHNSIFGYCLDNLIGGYSSLEPIINKGSKLIFENLLYYLKIKK